MRGAASSALAALGRAVLSLPPTVVHAHAARATAPRAPAAAAAAAAQRRGRSDATAAEESGAAGEVHITDACVERLRALGASGGDAVLRVSVDGGGCSGFQYSFSLEGAGTDPGPSDRVFRRDGAVVLVDDISLEFLQGATIDYTEELIRSSFQITANPNAESACGCGSSFQAKVD